MQAMTTDARGAEALVRSLRAVAPDEGEAVWFTGNRITLKATAETTGGAYGLVEAVAPPGSSPPLHVHHREDEAFWVLEGELTFRCGEETLTRGPGTLVFLPRDVPHSFVVEGAQPARFLGLCSPGGFERYFVAAGQPAADAGLPPAGPPDIPLLKRVAAGFGAEIIGPPLRPR